MINQLEYKLCQGNTCEWWWCIIEWYSNRWRYTRVVSRRLWWWDDRVGHEPRSRSKFRSRGVHQKGRRPTERVQRPLPLSSLTSRTRRTTMRTDEAVQGTRGCSGCSRTRITPILRQSPVQNSVPGIGSHSKEWTTLSRTQKTPTWTPSVPSNASTASGAWKAVVRRATVTPSPAQAEALEEVVTEVPLPCRRRWQSRGSWRSTFKAAICTRHRVSCRRRRHQRTPPRLSTARRWCHQNAGERRSSGTDLRTRHVVQLSRWSPVFG